MESYSTGRLLKRHGIIGIPQIFLAEHEQFHPLGVVLRSEETPSNVRVFKDGKLIRIESPEGNVIERYD